MKPSAAVAALTIVLSVSACSSTPDRDEAQIEKNSVELIQAALPNFDRDEALKAMSNACAALDEQPDVARVETLTLTLAKVLGGDAKSVIGAKVLVAAAVASKCPQHSDLMEEADAR